MWTKILAMSFNLDVVKNKLSDNRAIKFAEHCGKIIIRSKEREVSHWVNELYGFCSWIMQTRIKPNNKPVSKELIMDNFFGYSDSVDTFVPVLNNAYSLYVGSGNRDSSKDEKIFQNYRNFCEQVAELLSRRELTTIKLEQLVNQYLIIK